MKENIKKILREDTSKNILGVPVTNTNVLIIMSGISGSGKSTKAKELVGNGAIHSTDDVIEASGDYAKFFEYMIAHKDFAPLSRAHNENFKNAVQSMKDGVSPVVIDNTNLSPSEPKNYVETALKMGYADDNIKFVDVGTGGASAEELADRNSHGVPLDKIKAMIDKHKAHAPLDLKKVVGAKPMHENKQKNKILYSAVVLDEKSKDKLLTALGHHIPEGWKTFANHMTIVFGKGLPDNLKDDLGSTISLRATRLGRSDMAMAVEVRGYESTNEIPHITIAVNVGEGGKPKDSNLIKNWRPFGSHINLTGVVTEVKPK
jgi:predicted kinase